MIKSNEKEKPTRLEILTQRENIETINLLDSNLSGLRIEGIIPMNDRVYHKDLILSFHDNEIASVNLPLVIRKTVSDYQFGEYIFQQFDASKNTNAIFISTSYTRININPQPTVKKGDVLIFPLSFLIDGERVYALIGGVRYTLDHIPSNSINILQTR